MEALRYVVETVKVYINSRIKDLKDNELQTDKTLSQQGKAADAQVVGDMLREIKPDAVVDNFCVVDLTNTNLVFNLYNKIDYDVIDITNEVSILDIKDALKNNKTVLLCYNAKIVGTTENKQYTYLNSISNIDDGNAFIARGMIDASKDNGSISIIQATLEVTQLTCTIKYNDHYIQVDNTLTQSGHPADAKAVGDKFSAIPVVIAEDGYTDISYLRQATAISIVRDGQTITVVTTLQGDITNTDIITLNDEDYPISIKTNGEICPITWEGL